MVLKLNGGLGTSMGLDKAKSLLKVKGENTFLDLTAKQVISMREEFGLNVKFMLMNSFNTSKDTLSFLAKYPSIVADPNVELMQNKVTTSVLTSLCSYISINRYPRSMQKRFSPSNGLLIPTWSGAPLVTVIFTRLSTARANWTHY